MGTQNRSVIRYFILAFMVMGSVQAVAQEATDTGEGVTFEYAKRTVINFDDDTIEGSLKTPDGQYLEVRKHIRHESLIRIRRNFKQAVISSFSNL